MIGHLRGKLLKVSPEKILLDVHGVGYEVLIPLSTYYQLQSAADLEVALHIHTHVREDAISLFGFSTEKERHLFEKLIAVSGIGPRLARAVLSGLPAEELIAALAAGDLARLSRVPGVGKKTAERMVVELKDKMREIATERSPSPAGAEDDVVLALVNLGYKQPVAERVVAQIRAESPRLPVASLLRESLKHLSRV